MRYFSWWLGQQLQEDKRPVVDKTGLGTNFYDFSLSFRPLSPTATESLDRPSLFDALREQLGLRLQAQRGMVQYLVIDRIERAGGELVLRQGATARSRKTGYGENVADTSAQSIRSDLRRPQTRGNLQSEQL